MKEIGSYVEIVISVKSDAFEANFLLPMMQCGHILFCKKYMNTVLWKILAKNVNCKLLKTKIVKDAKICSCSSNGI